MKLPYRLFLFVILFVSTACFGQKLVQAVSDVGQLAIHKEQFIGQPLNILLAQIEPAIKYVYGNPENRWRGAVGGTYLKFHFVDKQEYGEMLRQNKKPAGVVVSFSLEPNSSRKPLPKGGIPLWTDEQKREYGDMIIADIRITGG
ncbi:hypothetical protein [Flavisolibacter tropicus]|uniref:Uncharacterized protein n=1 Tax=Flavisolibacter tropicus TaxID=1492898 RepID=A0A172TWA4_9BACT|nr:hypothetical protein [Flavisolibacter tropicus]ANE51238.1 hypothetical protein SY85_12700 [Flavisolibacter tropicus]